MHDRIHNLLVKLSERDRRIMMALFVEKRDMTEVCREFGVGREYLRVLMYRFKKLVDSDYPPEVGDGTGVPVDKPKVH